MTESMKSILVPITFYYQLHTMSMFVNSVHNRVMIKVVKMPYLVNYDE